jgi:hypothetical protein
MSITKKKKKEKSPKINHINNECQNNIPLNFYMFVDIAFDLILYFTLPYNITSRLFYLGGKKSSQKYKLLCSSCDILGGGKSPFELHFHLFFFPPLFIFICSGKDPPLLLFFPINMDFVSQFQ